MTRTVSCQAQGALLPCFCGKNSSSASCRAAVLHWSISLLDTAAGAMISQTERSTLGLLTLAYIGIAATHLNGVQGTVVIAVIGTTVDGTLNALVDILHDQILLFGYRP